MTNTVMFMTEVLKVVGVSTYKAQQRCIWEDVRNELQTSAHRYSLELREHEARGWSIGQHPQAATRHCAFQGIQRS